MSTAEVEALSAESSPHVSVLVCTCNRQDNVVPTIRSVQACGFADFELIVLDQSRDDSTERAVRALCAEDARLTYARLDRASKPRALNRGRQLARGQFIFLTDDDCEVDAGWITAMLRVFDADPRVGCVFGSVEAGPCDGRDGYIPACPITRAHTISALSEFLTMPGWGNFGMGASLALRTDALLRIGGWDPCIGPGALFRSGDDHDVVARLLASGCSLAFCPTSRVVHFGLRYWKSAGDDQARYGMGMGAAFAKHMRTGSYYPGPLRVLRDGLSRLQLRRRPFGLAYPRNWLRGFVRGLRHPIDVDTRCFIAPDGGSGASDASSAVAQVVLRRVQAGGVTSAPQGP